MRLHSSLSLIILQIQEQLKTLPPDYLGKPLLLGKFSPGQLVRRTAGISHRKKERNKWDLSSRGWLQELLKELNEALQEEYTQRKQVLLKRLDVTLQTFLWGIKEKVLSGSMNLPVCEGVCE